MSGPGSIFKIFARSPIEPIEKHMHEAFASATQLIPFFTAVIQQDWQTADHLQEEIVALENTADELKKDLRISLSNNLFLSIPRADILELLYYQDRIANKAKDIAGLVRGRKMTLPTTLQPTFLQLVDQSVAAVAQANQAVSELHELVETGFRGKEVKIVTDMITELDTLENETDHLQREVRQQLFTLENDLPPVNVMFLYKVIEWTGDLADIAQQVGNRLQLILAH